MVLAHRDNRARLRSFLAFARVHNKANLVADGKFVEAVVDDGVAMEVDFLAIGGGDKTVIFLG